MGWSDGPRDYPIKQREHRFGEAGGKWRAFAIPRPAIDQHIDMIDRTKQRQNSFDHIREVITGFFGKMREVPGGPGGLELSLARPGSSNKVLSKAPPLVLIANDIS